MSTQLLLLLIGAGVLIAVVVVFAMVMEKKLFAERESVWRAVAERRGGRHYPGEPGRFGWQKPQAIEVMASGARVYVDTFRVSEEETATVLTRLRAECVGGPGPRYDLHVAALLMSDPRRVMLGGNAAFDAAFALRTDAPPQAVAAVWTPRARELMAQHLQGQTIIVQSDGRLITMTWHGDEREPQRLEAAIDVMGELVQCGRAAPAGGAWR